MNSSGVKQVSIHTLTLLRLISEPQLCLSWKFLQIVNEKKMHVMYLLCVVHRGLLNVSGLVVIHYHLLGEISKIEMDTKRKVLVSALR